MHTLKATDKNSEYIIVIGLPRQYKLRERATVLRYTYTACFVNVKILLKTIFYESYVSLYIYEYIKFEACNNTEELLSLLLTPSSTVILLLMMTGNYKTWLSDGSKWSDVHINLLHGPERFTS